MSRFANLDEIRKLDPEKDHQRIAYLDTVFEFPWDTTRSLEFALFRTYAVPRSSALLVHTQELEVRTQKRYDDTVLILSEIVEHGYDSERGRAALKRMNQQHGTYRISNEEFLYVLTTFVFEPIRWMERFAWRPMIEQEKLANYYYWRELGKRMGIKNIPDTYEKLEQYNRDYEAQNFAFAESNRRIGRATVNLMLGWFLPRWLYWLGEPFVYAMMDDRLIEAFGFPKQPAFLQKLVAFSLKLRGRIIRLLPPRRTPRLLTASKNRTYPNGYQIEQLGPPIDHQHELAATWQSDSEAR
jgi:ER-bound oxygenase mpaB/B'/Rubber oxygenase, catalytic domain